MKKTRRLHLPESRNADSEAQESQANTPKKAEADTENGTAALSSERAPAAPVRMSRTAKKKLLKKRILLGAAALAVIAVALLLLFPGRKAALALDPGDTVLLSFGDFSRTVSATGRVESSDSHSVYSTQTYVVEEIFIKVGDRVAPDTLLCQLDTAALQEQIETKELSSGLSAASAAQSVKAARDSYNAARNALESGENTALLSASSSVRTAYESWQRAYKTYSDYYDTVRSGLNASLLTQDAAVESARTALDSAKSAYQAALSEAEAAKAALAAYQPDPSGNQAAVDAAKVARDGALLDQSLKQADYEAAVVAYNAAQTAYTADTSDANRLALDDAREAHNAAIAALDASKAATAAAEAALSEAEARLAAETDAKREELQAAYDKLAAVLAQAETAQTAAETGYDNAVKAREAAYRTADNTLADYAVNVDNAYAAYQAALASYGAAETGAETSLTGSYNSLKSAELSASTDLAELELANLQEKLDSTSIRAGVSGTVTAVYAKVGSSGNGLLFVVEDISDLIVETSVKEYDVASIVPGLAVSIKSNATGEEEFAGTVLSVAPTVNKDAMGETDTTGDAEFSVKVKVTEKDTPLRIGMNVRLNYILEERQQVLTVPYDAVYTNGAGESCVLAAVDLYTGKFRLQEIPVTRVTENDLDVVVEADGLYDGLRIVLTPEAWAALAGQEVELVQQKTAPGAMFPMGGMGGSAG